MFPPFCVWVPVAVVLSLSATMFNSLSYLELIVVACRVIRPRLSGEASPMFPHVLQFVRPPPSRRFLAPLTYPFRILNAGVWSIVSAPPFSYHLPHRLLPLTVPSMERYVALPAPVRDQTQSAWCTHSSAELQLTIAVDGNRELPIQQDEEEDKPKRRVRGERRANIWLVLR